MPLPNARQALIAENVVLDGRLALFHQKQRWLAVADLHFGYEISQRAAGGLFPLWGMSSLEERLGTLIAEYKPKRLVIVGDLVHNRASLGEAQLLLERLGTVCEPVVLAGNHDRHLRGAIPMLPAWETPGFYFHHGHCEAQVPGRIQVIGHHHPAGNVSDGAGLRLKLPAFVQQGNCWILPAFSPWAGGVVWPADSESQIWLCSPGRVLRLPARTPVPA